MMKSEIWFKKAEQFVRLALTDSGTGLLRAARVDWYTIEWCLRSIVSAARSPSMTIAAWWS